MTDFDVISSSTISRSGPKNQRSCRTRGGRSFDILDCLVRYLDIEFDAAIEIAEKIDA
jgi:hypothetical protein